MKKLNNTYIDSLVTKILNETIQERADELSEKLTHSMDEGMGETCEQCGKMMTEGVCEQCSMEEGLYDVSGKFPKKQSFDYVQEENEFEMMGADDDNDPLDRMERFCNTESEEYSEETCKYHKSMVTEKLHGNQHRLDHNKNKRIDSEDLRMARDKKSKKIETDEEVEEGNAFTGALANAKKEGDKTFEVDGKKFNVKESVKLTENEMIDLIERIVKEEKLKATAKPKGLATYEKAHKGSGNENEDYLKSVTKKMKDYLKDGSKGDYDTNPKIFPKGNGELAKMDKKAYVPSDAVKDYTDNFTAAGLENLDYDEIQPNEEWVSDNIVGSSKTGNNPKWANTGESDVNKKRNEIRKNNYLAKLKRKAYNKAPQPTVIDKSGDNKGTNILTKLESVEEKNQNKINEEFDRMKNLISYNQKTQ
jgi:hypothetical protein